VYDWVRGSERRGENRWWVRQHTDEGSYYGEEKEGVGDSGGDIEYKNHIDNSTK
jgi:hypothetical protein